MRPTSASSALVACATRSAALSPAVSSAPAARAAINPNVMVCAYASANSPSVASGNNSDRQSSATATSPSDPAVSSV